MYYYFMGLFYVQSLYVSFLYTKPPIYMGPSYVLLHPFYIRWSIYRHIVLYAIAITGPSYVHHLLWGLTPAT